MSTATNAAPTSKSSEGPVRVLSRPPESIVLIGAGGTGGALLQPLCRLLYSMDELAREARNSPRLVSDDEWEIDAAHQGAPSLTIVDGDTVQSYNIRRQIFVESDAGKRKALVLASRYSAAFGIEVDAYPHYLSPGIGPKDFAKIIPNESVVIGAVDNAATRRLLHERLGGYHEVVYLDAGNAGVPAQSTQTDQTPHELAATTDAGYDGQVACGARHNGSTILPFPADVFPELVEVEDPDDRMPTEIPCGEAVVSQPQRLITNIQAATVLLSYLTPILTEGVVPNHLTFFDSRKGYQRSQRAVQL